MSNNGNFLRILFCGLLAVAVYSHPASAAEFAGASGMAWISGNSYLCVQDLKSNRQGSRVGVLTIDTEHGGYDYLPLEPDWGAELPHDMESVYGFKTRPGEFLMAESGSYENWDTHEYHVGRIFHVKLEEQEDGWQLSVLGTIPIPENIHEIEGMFSTGVSNPSEWLRTRDIFGDWAEYISTPGTSGWASIPDEAADSAAGSESANADSSPATPPAEPRKRELAYLVLGTRGGDRPYEPAMLYSCVIDLLGHELYLMFDGNGRELSVPRQSNPFERGCSDLYLDEVGVLWVAACSDQGDSGPFDSRIYRYGKYQIDSSYMSSPSYDSPVWNLGGLKVEALCGCSIEGSTLCFATDDEGYGGIWRSLGPASNARY